MVPSTSSLCKKKNTDYICLIIILRGKKVPRLIHRSSFFILFLEFLNQLNLPPVTCMNPVPEKHNIIARKRGLSFLNLMSKLSQ